MTYRIRLIGIAELLRNATHSVETFGLNGVEDSKFEHSCGNVR